MLAATRTAREEIVESPAIRTETISDYQRFLDLEPVWSELVTAAGIDHPFLEHAWVRTWWECFGNGSALHIVVAKSGDEVVAIAPLILTPVRMFGLRVRRLGFFYNEHVPRTGFIVAERAGEAYRAIWEHLMSERRQWDLLQLCQLPEGSATLEEIRELAADARLPQGLWLSGESPWVSLDNWSRYYGNLASKFRSNLRNRFKRLSQTGPLTVETVCAQESVPQAFEAGLRLEEAAWKGEAGTAISCDPQVRRFYETFAARAADKNWLRLNFLKAGKQRVAFDYTLAYNDQLFLLKTGYDPAFAAYSPTNLLISMLLAKAAESGQAKFDFLGDSADWKRCWAKDATRHHWLFVFRGGLKGRWLHGLKFRLGPSLKKYVLKMYAARIARSDDEQGDRI
jgi:CelD/BcsL family acetyltransferase involved in cellulose biosynthesis